VTRLPPDQGVRDALLTELDTTFVVEAAAGSGKTTVLVGRIVQVVQRGRARLDQVAAVTFTEKAAGEMKLRLRDALEQARRATDHPAETERLTRALEALEVAHLSTIHGLCADLLREHPVEAGVDPHFQVVSEADADALLHAAFTRQFQELLRAPPEGVRRMLRRRARGPDQPPPRRRLEDAVRSLLEHRDFTAPWRRDPWDRDAAVDGLLPSLAALAELSPRLQLKPGKSSPFLEVVHEVQRFLLDLRHRELVAPRDHDGLEAQLHDVGGRVAYRWTGPPWGLQYEGVSEAELVAARDAAWAALLEFRSRSEADLAACLHRELWPVVEAYQAEKATAGVLDFVDLLLRMRDLVRSDDRVRQTLQRRFTHLFVDEFQDTDPLQSELLLLLAADDPQERDHRRVRPRAGTLFVVGDPRQSIYRFRRADVALYERVKAQLLEHGGTLARLTTSFRGTPGIQAAINGAFEGSLTAGGQATGVALQPFRAAVSSQPSVVALPAPRPFGPKGKPTKDAAENSLSVAVAGFVEWLVGKSGWTVEEDGARVPVAPRHVCLLFKRHRRYPGVDVMGTYAQALEQRSVPHVLVGGRRFHAREEVAALRTALLAVERPDDELSVFATLRGPFFALSDEQLLVFRHQGGRLHTLWPQATLELTAPSVEVREALEVLGALHRRRNRRGVAETIHALLEETRAHAGVAFWASGAQALANLLQVAQVARRHEARTTSFREVVEALEDEAARGQAAEAPIVEEGTEGVRMMTAHGAKGLEFPVVILAEPSAPAQYAEPSMWVDPDRGLWAHALAGCVPVELRERAVEVRERDREESVRLTYVAATRARDLLVVPVHSERPPDDDWTSVLAPALWPKLDTAHAPRPAPGCPAFGRDVVLDREGPLPPGVPMPGLHLARTGKNGVVWWDPRTLDLDRPEREGLESSDALQEEPVAAAEGRAGWEAWQAGRLAALSQGAAQAVRVRLAREVEALPPGVLVEDATTPRAAARPAGTRFGELVHAALAHVPLVASPAVVGRVVEVHARALFATAEEAAAAVEAVVQALAHPLLEAARRADEVRREEPVVDVVAPGEVVEGTVDLAFGGPRGWTVVDFKTDLDPLAHRDAYAAQVGAYVRAIARATGAPVRGVLLWV
jgi:ATP-dependent exoDNAse (exonuclease V) beta subunit